MTNRERMALSLVAAMGVLQLLQLAYPALAQTPASSNARDGRYEIVISQHLRRDTFLLDTQTGRIWVRGQYTDLKEEPMVWRPETRVDSEKEFQAWWHSFTPKEE